MRLQEQNRKELKKKMKELFKKTGIVTRMISAENPTGEKGKGAMAKINPQDPELFFSKNCVEEGYKVCPFVRIEANSTRVLANYKGSGIIKHIFLTSDRRKYSELVLRIYWDDEKEPSVECPLGMFFCMGHDAHPHLVNSLPIAVAPHRGLNSYFEMPFRKGFRIELENQGDDMTWIVAYKITFTEEKVDDDVGYFHAQYRHTLTTPEYPVHTILDGVKGEGVYVGTYLAWSELHDRWWGEGEVKFYLDGDKKYPTICDNGTEDYFGGAWNFGAYGIIPGSDEILYQTPYLGLSLAEVKTKPKRFSMHRFHIVDAIGFKKDIRVTVDAIGWREDFKKYQHRDADIKSVAFYYQKEPHIKFPKLEEKEKRYDYVPEEK